MKAVHFGAGNIGRGFIGLLLSLSGFEVVFIDINKELISLLKQEKYYTVRLVGDKVEEIIIHDFRVINGKDKENVVENISNADIITTAIGPDNLKYIAPLLDEGIRKRVELKVNRPLNIIACENILDNSIILKEQVKSNLQIKYWGYVNTYVEFPNTRARISCCCRRLS